MSDKRLTPLQAIRKHCIDCCGSQKAPKYCQDTECEFYEFREGHNPQRKNIGGRGRKKDFHNLSRQNGTNKGIPVDVSDGILNFPKGVPSGKYKLTPVVSKKER